jgi:hypothetical protein
MRTIKIGKAYVFQDEQWYGAQIGDDGPRMVGTSPAYALGELLGVYPRLLGEHRIEIKHSYPKPPAGYVASVPELRLEVTVSDVEPVAVGLLAMGYAHKLGLTLIFVDELPKKREAPAGSYHNDGGPCTCH